MKKWNINAIVYNDNTTFKFELTYPAEDGTLQTIFDDATFKDKILYNFTSWCITSPTFYDPVSKTIIDTVNDMNGAVRLFQDLFTIWLKNRREPLGRLFNALRKEYNPIWNVDGVTGTIHEVEGTNTGTQSNDHSGHDKTSTDDKGDITKSGNIARTKSGEVDNTRTGNETIVGSGTDTDTTSKTTFDSANFKDTDKLATAYGKTDTHTYNNVKDAETYSNYEERETYNSVKDTHNLNGSSDVVYDSKLKRTDDLKHYEKTLEMVIRQGNIGVTMTQQLLNAEIDLREKDTLIDYFISDFIHSNCVL